MESVINFLADYYIWFFVAAGILVFALIGFIIESKKKDKNNFKGESIDNNVSLENNVNNEVNNQVEEVNTLENLNTNDSVNQSIDTPQVGEQEEMLNEQINTLESTPVMENNEDTMEINDIPLKDEEKTPIEFYNEPVQSFESTQSNEENITNDTPVVDLNSSDSNENLETLNIFDDIK